MMIEHNNICFVQIDVTHSTEFNLLVYLGRRTEFSSNLHIVQSEDPNDITIECEVSNTTVPLQWVKDGNPILKAPRLQFSAFCPSDCQTLIERDLDDRTHRLVIHAATYFDLGEYMVWIPRNKNRSELKITRTLQMFTIQYFIFI